MVSSISFMGGKTATAKELTEQLIKNRKASNTGINPEQLVDKAVAERFVGPRGVIQKETAQVADFIPESAFMPAPTKTVDTKALEATKINADKLAEAYKAAHGIM